MFSNFIFLFLLSSLHFDLLIIDDLIYLSLKKDCPPFNWFTNDWRFSPAFSFFKKMIVVSLIKVGIVSLLMWFVLVLADNGTCLGWREAPSKQYQWIRYEEALLRSQNFGSGLVALGLAPGTQTMVGIYSQNCPEWVLCEQALYCYSMVVVPLYDTLGPEACKYIVNQGWPRLFRNTLQTKFTACTNVWIVFFSQLTLARWYAKTMPSACRCWTILRCVSRIWSTSSQLQNLPWNWRILKASNCTVSNKLSRSALQTCT